MTLAQRSLLRARWNRARLLRAGMESAGLGLLAAALALAGSAFGGLSPAWMTLLPLGAGCAAALAAFLRRRPVRATQAELVSHLDRTYPEFEDSSSLWLRRADELGTLERLQLRRIDAAWERALSEPRPGRPSPLGPAPGYLRRSAALVALGACAAFGAFLLAGHPAPPAAGRAHGPAATASSAAVPSQGARLPGLRSGGLSIEPPAYTRRPPRAVAGLDAEVEEGSAVRWDLEFDAPVLAASLVLGEGPGGRLELKPTEGRFTGGAVIRSTQIYRIAIALPGGARMDLPAVHALKVVADQPPSVEVVAPASARTQIDPSVPDGWKVEIRVSATDDYGLGSARLVATLAKGTGEGVKFREQSIPLEGAGGEVKHTYSKVLDLAKLGLEPGDELYFHAVVGDQRTPQPNLAVSETRFISVKGGDEHTSASGLGVTGVNLVPEYFRSERQLILDTERLVADRASIPEPEFRRRSEDLGYDQGLLKMRYGQFMGQEDDDDAAVSPDEARKRKLAAAQPERGVPAKSAEILAPYVDQHDSAEATTLFDQEVKGSLREVIAAMWEAEGQLRTDRPEQALPAENRALRVLKALQQGSRLYVQRVGFEPAPLDLDGRRLKGDLAGVGPSGSFEEAAPQADAEAGRIRSALAAVDWSRAGEPLDTAQLRLLSGAEPLLTRAATRDPEANVAALEALRRAVAERSLPAGAPDTLQKALLRLLPPAELLPALRREDAPSLSAPYLRALAPEVQP